MGGLFGTSRVLALILFLNSKKNWKICNLGFSQKITVRININMNLHQSPTTFMYVISKKKVRKEVIYFFIYLLALSYWQAHSKIFITLQYSVYYTVLSSKSYLKDFFFLDFRFGRGAVVSTCTNRFSPWHTKLESRMGSMFLCTSSSLRFSLQQIT